MGVAHTSSGHAATGPCLTKREVSNDSLHTPSRLAKQVEKLEREGKRKERKECKDVRARSDSAAVASGGSVLILSRSVCISVRLSLMVVDVHVSERVGDLAVAGYSVVLAHDA